MTDSDHVPLARSSASALHSILETLVSTEAPNMAVAWSRVLNEEFGSFEFCRKHGEVVRLWNDTLDEISALAPERAKSRFQSHTVFWWSAVINPKNQWEGNLQPSQLIAQTELDHLASVGDLVSAQIQGNTRAPTAGDLAELREQCEEWLALLQDTEEIGNDSFRQTLLAQVQHLIWLIDNVDQFGVSRVVENSDTLTGTLLRTVGTPQARVKNSEQFWNRIRKLIVVVGMIAGIIHDSQTILEAAEHSMPVIEKVVHKITDARPTQNDRTFPNELTRDGGNDIE